MRRGPLLLAAAIAVAAALLGLLLVDRRGGSAPPPGEPLDERLALLLDPSMARGPYPGDVADVTPILVEVLRSAGDHEPLRAAKTELAADSERGLPAVRRFVERYRTDPLGSDYLRNAADVLSQSADPEAKALLASLLTHPSESLRVQALRGLLVHPTPASFEPVLRMLASAPPGYELEFCAALGQLDLARAQELWLSWIETGVNPQLWPAVLPSLALVREPELQARAAKLLEREDLGVAAPLWLSAALCGAGDHPKDPVALARLRAASESKNPTERDLAVRALVAAGRFDELARTLPREELGQLRLFAVRAAAAQPSNADARALLELAVNDSDPAVRLEALEALAAGGRAEALDQGLQLLQSRALVEVQSGIVVLREVMASDPELARRVWQALAPRLAAFDELSPVEGAMLVKVLGQIPVREGTRALLALALAAKGELEGTRAQRYVLRQSVNAGAVAQDELYDLWRTSEVPLVRLDALEAFSALGGAHARELLVRVLDDPRATPQEMVYVADRLVRIGPAREVAWQLKRAALRIEDARAREALQGILWRWYPPPRAERD